MRSVKTVLLCYQASEELAFLFEEFRLMCNDAIRLAFAHENEHEGERVRSRFQLIELAYARLKEYGLHTHYILSACEMAFSVYRNKNRKSNPYFRKAFLKLDNQSYVINHLIVRIPYRPRQFIYLTLEASDYQLSFLDDWTLKRGSVTITDHTICIAFSKETTIIEPLGKLGVDVNERNVTTSDTSGTTKVFDTLEVPEIKDRYRGIRAKIGMRTRQDRRISKSLYAKYGRRERSRTVQRLHRVSKAIVQQALEKRFGIVMENLKGIRRLYRKGNGQGTSYRGRLNSWTFREIQRQIEYKAAWLGIPVSYVNSRGTSSKCPECGSPLVELEGRRLLCPSCRQTGDRDVIASKNIMACVVPQVRLPRGSNEEEPRRQEDAGNPPSRWMEVSSTGQRDPKS